MKNLITIIFLLISGLSFACSCVVMEGVKRFTGADFVAEINIEKVTPNPDNKDFHNLEIEILKLYKGKETDFIKLRSNLNSSCAFLTPENSKWLIYASYDNEGVLVFGFCSGPKRIDKTFDEKLYPNANENYQKSLQRKFEVLSYLKNNHINPKNEFHLPLFIPKKKMDELKNFEIENDFFSLFEITVEEDLSISNITPIKEFKNNRASDKILQILKESLEVGNTRLTQIPHSVKLILPFYCYSANSKNPSFISTIDL